MDHIAYAMRKKHVVKGHVVMKAKRRIDYLYYIKAGDVAK